MFCLRRLLLPMRGFRHPFKYIEPYAALGREDIVLEIGVGDGYAAWTNAEKVNHYYGFDIARPLVEFLGDKNTLKNTHFKRVDITDTEGADIARFENRFDKIFSIDTLLHVESSVGFFKSVSKLLKPGGKSYIVFPNIPNYGITHFESGETLVNQIEASGLELETIHEIVDSPWLEFLKKALFSPLVFAYQEFRKKKDVANHPSCARFKNHKGEDYHQSQHFDGTTAFRLIRKDPWYRVLSNAYFELFWFFAGLGDVYHYRPLDNCRASLRERMPHRLLIIAKKT